MSDSGVNRFVAWLGCQTIGSNLRLSDFENCEPAQRAESRWCRRRRLLSLLSGLVCAPRTAQLLANGDRVLGTPPRFTRVRPPGGSHGNCRLLGKLLVTEISGNGRGNNRMDSGDAL